MRSAPRAGWLRGLLSPSLFAALGAFCSAQVVAEIAVSANDGKQVLDDGVQVVPAPLPADSLTLIDLSARPPRLLGSVEVPTSVIGPPGSVAVTPDESYALVTASRRVSSQDPRQIEPDDLLSVVDLKAKPLRVIATLHAGAGASGIAINPAGTLALVANRSEGTVSVFALAGGTVRTVNKIRLAEPASAPAQPMFFDGGRRALVSRDGDHKISLLHINGEAVTVAAETLVAGLRPYQIDTAGPRRYAVAANIGGAGRDVDTISLIDLTEPVPRVIDSVAVGLTPKGVKMSPDGRYIAVNVNNGSNASRNSPRYHAAGVLQLWRIEAGRLLKVTEIPIGGWGQGVAWSRDGRTLLSQAMVGNVIEAFSFDGHRLQPLATLHMPPGPAAIRTAEP